MNETQTIGIIGLGLLGKGIATSLLLGGYKVIACDKSPAARRAAHDHITTSIQEMARRDSETDESIARSWKQRYKETDNLSSLNCCDFVIESITEDLAAKSKLFDELEAAIGPDVPIASNTSAMPITLLQQGRRHPQRFVGMHWGEPAHLLKFMEIIRGQQTSDQAFEKVIALGESLGKEPTIVKKDVRGFVTNRLMYAMIREALHLLETGVADAQSIDRAFTTDMGWWAGFAGPFRWMDLTGLPLYSAVMADLFPELSDRKEVPQIMQKLMAKGAQGTTNGKGFYSYTPKQAEQWEKLWTEYTWQMRNLAKQMANEFPETKDEQDG